MTRIATGEPARHRVVVVGSGFGGLFATRRLARAAADVTLEDRTPGSAVDGHVKGRVRP
jgi:NADH:ubiquinone reductase (H+-translocating)